MSVCLVCSAMDPIGLKPALDGSMTSAASYRAMASAMGLRQAFPTHTKRTLVRLECRAPESAFFSFPTFRTSRCPPVDSFPPPQERGNVHAQWCRLSIQDE